MLPQTRPLLCSYMYLALPPQAPKSERVLVELESAGKRTNEEYILNRFFPIKKFFSSVVSLFFLAVPVCYLHWGTQFDLTFWEERRLVMRRTLGTQ